MVDKTNPARLLRDLVFLSDEGREDIWMMCRQSELGESRHPLRPHLNSALLARFSVLFCCCFSENMASESGASKHVRLDGLRLIVYYCLLFALLALDECSALLTYP